ncbi:MAG: acyl-CoA dehydrogenase family protein, partial [Pseudomonadales bacterium]|nr:acyl-CoA dehydrogenase family protein [Pseudomonadales bacterium]
MANLDTFKSEATAWLEENCPASMRKHGGGADAEFTRKKRSGDSLLWLDRCAEKGWIAPSWPTEYGGGGLSTEEHVALVGIMKKMNIPAPLG